MLVLVALGAAIVDNYILIEIRQDTDKVASVRLINTQDHEIILELAMLPFCETSVLDLTGCDGGEAVGGADILNSDSEIRGKPD